MILIARTKFNVDKDVEKRTYDGITFDSILEMKYYRDVLLPKLNSGEVIDYSLQKPYELQPGFIHNGKKVRPIIYTADFFIRYNDGHEEVIDTKGYPTPNALMKRKLFWYIYPNIEYRWITYVKKYGGWIECDEYSKLKKQAKKEKEKKYGEEETGKWNAT